MKSDSIKKYQLTSALEDYLETIFQFIQLQGFVRVKDIVKVRNVKAGSVSPAMKRLKEMGLLDYERREYIKLTEEGERVARQIFARHKVLTRFFHEVLRLDEDEAVENACAMEHSLTLSAMDHLSMFMEYLINCPHAKLDYWTRFNICQLSDNSINCSDNCSEDCVFCKSKDSESAGFLTIKDLIPGDCGQIVRIVGDTETRRKLIQIGILPGCNFCINHYYPDGKFLSITLDNFQLKFPLSDTSNVVIIRKDKSS